MSEPINRAEVDSALASILRDSKFVAAPQASAFLRYVVEQTLDGKSNRIKAYTIAVDALGKPTTFDPQNDPSVRVLAKRIRSSLEQYYEHNRSVPLKVDLKSGSYVPTFVKPKVEATPVDTQISLSTGLAIPAPVASCVLTDSGKIDHQAAGSAIVPGNANSENTSYASAKTTVAAGPVTPPLKSLTDIAQTQNNNNKRIKEDEARAFVLSAIILSSSVFGIAFWYGVFNTVFFEHIFYIWVVATVALITSLFVPPLDALPAFMSWRGRFVLILPSVWMLWLGFGGGGVAEMAQAGWFTWLLTIAVLVLTLPYLLYVLVMVAVPDVERLKHPHLRVMTIAVTLAIALTGYAIGRHHPRFLTCYDFRVSGSYVPEHCTVDPQHP